MAMLQSLGSSQPALYEDRGDGLDPGRFVATFRRRIFYFAIPFILVLIAGFLLVAIQRPIYEAEGKILVESPEIPTTLVQPTVTAAATERIQVIQQRIMTRENLLGIVKKFGLFPSQQTWMSGTQLLDLMLQRTEIALVDIDTALAPSKDGKRSAPRNNNSNNSAIAFTISFDYENPELAMKVANEFLTLVLNEDVRARTNRATETTQFLAREVKRLQGETNSIDAQLIEAKRQLSESAQKLDDNTPDQLKTRMATLTAMKTDLIQKSSVYSDSHPAIKSLKKRIAALEKEISDTPKSETAVAQKTTTAAIEDFEQRKASLEKELDDASKKLTAAHLGESMERDQQAEHLQVIEQPALPQKPIKPKRLKLFALSAALAMMAGVGTVVLAEMFDKTIRGSHDLVGVVNSHLLVLVPYITTAGEIARKKRRIRVLWVLLGLVLIGGLCAVYYVGVEFDASWFDRSWIDTLTRLTK
jgi:uncharacterized protein involved in exopolysaccharide biosynthesis